MKTLLLAVTCLMITLPLAPARGDDKPEAGAAPITLHINSGHPRDAVAELSEKTGVVIQFWPEQMWDRTQPNQPTSINVDADNKSFWEVMQQICDGAKLRPANMGNSSGITLQQGGDNGWTGKRPLYTSATAMIAVDSIQRNHSIHFESGDAQTQRSCGISITAYVDPRLRMTKYVSTPNIEEAKDENGTSLVVASNRSGDSRQTASCRWELQGLFVPLDYDPQTSKKLATLKGTVRISVAAEVEKLDLELASAQGVEKSIAGMDVTVTEVKESDHATNVKIIIVRKEASKQQFNDTLSDVFQSVSFVSSDGKTRRGGGGGGGSEAKREYTLGTSWSNDADKPVKLVWEIPTKVEDADLPFEFKDLPLP